MRRAGPKRETRDGPAGTPTGTRMGGMSRHDRPAGGIIGLSRRVHGPCQHHREPNASKHPPARVGGIAFLGVSVRQVVSQSAPQDAKTVISEIIRLFGRGPSARSGGVVAPGLHGGCSPVANPLQVPPQSQARHGPLRRPRDGVRAIRARVGESQLFSTWRDTPADMVARAETARKDAADAETPHRARLARRTRCYPQGADRRDGETNGSGTHATPRRQVTHAHAPQDCPAQTRPTTPHRARDATAPDRVKP